MIGLLLFHTISTNDSNVGTIFLITGILSLYFIMPLLKKPLINYLIILCMIALSAFASINILYSLPLFGFFIVQGTFQLKEKNFYIMIGFSLFIFIVLTLINELPMYALFLLGTIIVSCCFLHQYVEQVKLKSILYEQLLTQFRHLKRMSVEQEQLVRAEERTKIARDMHDSVGHKLTSLLMQLEMMSIQNTTEHIQDVKELARESLEETRFAVRKLKSTETSGIQSVIQLIRKLEMESRLNIRFTLEKGVLSLPITNEQSVVLYRVLQESLTNAMKHSHSKEVDVILGVDSLQHVQFEVKNKFSTDVPIIKGFGLTNMEERLQEIGGQLRILRTQQQFILRGTFPLKESFVNEYYNDSEEGEYSDNTHITR